MPKYMVRFAETLLYEIEVTATDKDNALDIALQNSEPADAIVGWVEERHTLVTAINTKRDRTPNIEP